MKITRKQIRKIILEELETLSYEEKTIDAEQAESAQLEKDRAEDIVTVPDAWAGGPNLVHSMDHSDAVDSEPVTRGQETLKIVEEILRTTILREQGKIGATAELTEIPDRRAVSDAWPNGVTHNGENVFEKFYNSPGSLGLNDADDWIRREGYDGQEVYLGYDPQSDSFFMGFDAFYDEVDEYGYSDPEGMMEGVIVNLTPEGRAVETVTSVPGGMYPAGLKAIETAVPGIIHVRLD